MMRESKNRIFFILGLLVILITITGCSSGNVAQKYYTGYNSVEMRFLQDTPPVTFYYDGAPTNPNVNIIPINVELHNQGSSDSYGALFIHGFDPNIIAVKGYSSNYPLNLYSGAVRGTDMFGGWYGDNNNFAISALNLNIGGRSVSLGLSSLGGQKSISFSSFGYTDRSSLFSAMNFQTRAGTAGYGGISPGVVQGRIGSVLNPITKSMMNTAFHWGGWLQHIELEGRNRDNPNGGTDVIDFSAIILPTLPPSLEQFTQRIMVTSCFDYATHASAMVCIDPEPYSNVKKACNPITVALGGGQGAPVAITSVEQRPGRGRTTFVINVHHTKADSYDELYDYFSLYKCDPASGAVVKTNDKNIIYVGYVYLSDMDITMNCVPDQIIRLDDSGNGQITCSVVFPVNIASSAYQAPLEVELWYGYSKTIFKDVLIKRI